MTSDANELERDLTESSSSDWLKRSKMPERCVAARCDNTADPAKGISMHRIPFLNSENPIAQRRRKKWIDFVLKEELGARQNVFIVLDTLQRGRSSVSFGLKNEAVFEV